MSPSAASHVSHHDIGEEFKRIRERLESSTSFDLREALPKSIAPSLSSENCAYHLSQLMTQASSAITADPNYWKDQAHPHFREVYGRLNGSTTDDLGDYVSKFFDAAQKKNLVWLGNKSGERNDVKEWNALALHDGNILKSADPATQKSDEQAKVGSLMMQDLIYTAVASISALQKIYEAQDNKKTLFSPESLLQSNLGAFVRELRDDGGFKEAYSSLGAIQVVYKTLAESMQLVYEPEKFGLVTSAQKVKNAEVETALEDQISKLAFKLLWDQSILTLNKYQEQGSPEFDKQAPIANRIIMASLQSLKQPGFNFTNLPEGADACHICVWPEAVGTAVGVQNTVLTFLMSKIPHDSGHLAYLSSDDWMVNSPLRGADNGARNGLMQYLHWKSRHTEIYPDAVIYEQTRLSKITDIVRFQLIAIFGEKLLEKNFLEKEMNKDWRRMNPIFREMFFPEILHYKLTEVSGTFFKELKSLVSPRLMQKTLSSEERQQLIDRLSVPHIADAPQSIKDLNKALLSLQIGDTFFANGVELAKYLFGEEAKKEGDSPLKGMFAKSSKHPAHQEDMMFKAADLGAYCTGIPATRVFEEVSGVNRTELTEYILKTVEDLSRLPFFSECDVSGPDNKVLRGKIDVMYEKEDGGMQVKHLAMALRYYLEQSRTKQYELSNELKSILSDLRQDDKSHNVVQLMIGTLPEQHRPDYSHQGLRSQMTGNLFMFNMSNFTFINSPYPEDLKETIYDFVYTSLEQLPNRLQVMKDIFQIFKNYDQTNSNGANEAHSLLVVLPFVVDRLNEYNVAIGAPLYNLDSVLRGIADAVFDNPDKRRLFEPVREAILALDNHYAPRDTMRVSADHNHNPLMEVYDLMNWKQDLSVPAFLNAINNNSVDAFRDQVKGFREQTLQGEDRNKLVEGKWLLIESQEEMRLLESCLDPAIDLDAYRQQVQDSHFNESPSILALDANLLADDQLAELIFDTGLFLAEGNEPDEVQAFENAKQDQLDQITTYLGTLDDVGKQKHQAYFFHVLYTNMEIYNHFTYRRDQPALSAFKRIRSDDNQAHKDYYQLVVQARHLGYHSPVSQPLTNWSQLLELDTPIAPTKERLGFLQFQPQDRGESIFLAPYNPKSDDNQPSSPPPPSTANQGTSPAPTSMPAIALPPAVTSLADLDKRILLVMAQGLQRLAEGMPDGE